MAVDAAARGVGCPDAGGNEDDVLLVAPMGCERIHQISLQGEDLIDRRGRCNVYSLLEGVDNDNNLFLGPADYSKGIEYGIFEISPEMASEIGDSRHVRNRRKENGHAFTRARKLRGPPEGPGTEYEWVLGIICRSAGRNPPVEKIETETRPPIKKSRTIGSSF